MADFFYDDCVISDIKALPNTRTGTVVSCKINGRLVPKMIMEKAMQRYLTENAAGEMHRVWFVVVSILGKRIITIRAIEAANGGRFVEEFKIGIAGTVFRSAGLGYLVWMFAYLAFGAVSAFLFRIDFEGLSIWAGVLSGIAMALWSFNLKINAHESKLQFWPEGDISRFTKAVKASKPAFESGFVAKMAKKAEDDKAVKSSDLTG